MSNKWPTFAETARVFKLSAATQRRISRQVDEFLEKRKDLLPATTGRRARALKASFAVSRPETVRPSDPDYELVPAVGANPPTPFRFERSKRVSPA